MKKILTSEQMQITEKNTIQNIGVPSLVLMERAALGAFEELKKGFDLTKVLVVSSNGNNGADGLAVARLLKNAGYDVKIWFVGDESKLTTEAKLQMDLAEKYGVAFEKDPLITEFTTVVDAIFGIGLNRDIKGIYEEVIERINNAKVPVLSIDIPSGINATSGVKMSCAVKASATVSFAYAKTGLYLNDGYTHCGKVIIKDIGIYSNDDLGINAIEDTDVPLLLPQRDIGGNKGTFGKVLIVSGSENMAGAAYLSAKAAFTSGVGMVKIFTDEKNRIILQQLLPEAMLCTYSSNDTKETVTEKLIKAEEWANAVLCGPGIGTGEIAKNITNHLLSEEIDKPLVLDADSLNIISENTDALKSSKREITITPHMGEMARLSGYSIKELKSSPFELIQKFNEEYNINIVMKDAKSIIMTKNKKIYMNLSGNDGMATAGSGDVLSGVIAGIISQGASLNTSPALCAYIHGRAGDRAAQHKGKRAVMASDIVKCVGEVLKELTEQVND